MDELSGTKESIFDAFVELVSTLGYENVSMRDIAKKVSVNSASIYYHFDSKTKILEYAYDYYLKHLYDTRKPVEVLKKLVETASADEIMKAMSYTFETEDRKKYVRMILITKIIYMRMFQDRTANEIFTESHSNSNEFVINILQHGIKVGRIDPGFDTEVFAEVLVGAKTIMGIKAFVAPTYVAGQIDQEAKILALFTRLLASAFLN